MDEDELDPRIQVELEKLNSATDVINKLEIELDEANTTFRMLLNECTRRLKIHSSKHGTSIENARPYYEALEVARKAQQECQQAAVSFQRANEVHEAAKETVTLAESRFMSQQPEWRFDSAWQEMLNHATIKVRDAEKQRAESSAYHGQATVKYKDAQEKVHALEQRLRRSVAKSRPYFEEKQRCNEQLNAQKEAVETLATKVARVKSEYAESLRQLEAISEEIHQKRGNKRMDLCGIREPGVGAELEYNEDPISASAESAFDKSSYRNLPKLGGDLTNSLTMTVASNCSTPDCADLDKVSLDLLANDEIWLDVEIGSQASDVCEGDGSQNINGNEIAFDRKLPFDDLHSERFNPLKKTPERASKEADLRSPGGVTTAELQIVPGSSKLIREDKFEPSPKYDFETEIKNNEIGSSLAQENGAKFFEDPVVLAEDEEDVANKPSEVCDVQGALRGDGEEGCSVKDGNRNKGATDDSWDVADKTAGLNLRNDTITRGDGRAQGDVRSAMEITNVQKVLGIGTDALELTSTGNNTHVQVTEECIEDK